MVLYGERKAFYDTKTTCFAVVEVAAYRLKVVVLGVWVVVDKWKVALPLEECHLYVCVGHDTNLTGWNPVAGIYRQAKRKTSRW